MANNGWDREIINPLEKPLGSDINVAQAQLDRATRESLMRLFTGRASAGTSDLPGNPPSGFLGDGFKVRQNSPLGLSVKVTLGLGFQYLPGSTLASVGGVSGLDDLSPYKPLPLLADCVINGISGGPGAGNTRIDIVEVRMNRVVGNSTSRRVLNPLTGIFEPLLVNKTLSFTLDGSVGVVTDPALSTAAVSYKMGIAGGVPAEPTVTPGYVQIAAIKVSTSLTQVTKSEIIDRRVLLAPFGQQHIAVNGIIPFAAGSPPSGVSFKAPPGVELVVRKLNTANNNRFAIYIIGGDGAFDFNVQGQAQQSLSTSSILLLLPVQAFADGTMDGALVALLADATTTFNAQTWAVGTKYQYAEFFAIHQTGATTDATLPNPLNFSLNGLIQRY